MNSEFETVYIFENPSFKENLIKIGKTDKNDPKERAKELYTTGVPEPFTVYYAVKVKKSLNLENKLHKLFSEYRHNNDREFFKYSKEKVKLAISLSDATEIDYLSGEEKKSIVEEKQFNILEANVPIGSKLFFKKDQKIHCTVHSKHLVFYNGKLLSLEDAAKSTGLVDQKNIYGPIFWLYENENLHNRRKKNL